MSTFSLTNILLAFLVSLTHFSVFRFARKFTPYLNWFDYTLFLIGLLTSLISIYIRGFSFLNLTLCLIICLFLWLKNPLIVIKSVLVLCVCGFFTSLLLFSLLFNYWLNNSSILPYFYLFIFLLFITIETQFNLISKIYDLSPIYTTQISAIIIPSAITILVILELDVAQIDKAISSLTVLLIFTILIIAYEQSLILKKFALVHYKLYTTLIDDFTHFVECDMSTRQTILNSINNSENKIDSHLIDDIFRILDLHHHKIYSNDPYLQLVIYGLAKEIPRLKVSCMFSDQNNFDIPTFTTWLEISIKLLSLKLPNTALTFTKLKTEHRIVITLDQQDLSSGFLIELVRPSLNQISQFSFSQDHSLYLLQIYLTSKLGLKGRIHHSSENILIIFERGQPK